MDTLEPGQALEPGASLVSANGYHKLIMQADGNLVLYSLGWAVWDSGTCGQPVKYLVMQYDGNLVIYDPDMKAIWDTHTDGNGGSRLQMQNDRNVVIYKEDPNPEGGYDATWNTETFTSEDLWENIEFEATDELQQVLEGARADALVGPTVEAGIICDTSPEGVVICVGAMVVIAIVLECNKDERWGPNNDLRVLGGKVADDVKDAGKAIWGVVKNLPVFPEPPMPVPKWPPW